MTAEEVAAILDISVNTLKGQYKRVIEILKNLIYNIYIK